MNRVVPCLQAEGHHRKIQRTIAAAAIAQPSQAAVSRVQCRSSGVIAAGADADKGTYQRGGMGNGICTCATWRDGQIRRGWEGRRHLARPGRPGAPGKMSGEWAMPLIERAACSDVCDGGGKQAQAAEQSSRA